MSLSIYKFLVLDFSFYSRKCTTNTKSSSTISIHWTASGIAFCWSITCSYCSWIRSCCAWTKSIKVRQTTKIGHKLIYRFTLGLRLRKLFCIFLKLYEFNYSKSKIREKQILGSPKPPEFFFFLLCPNLLHKLPFYSVWFFHDQQEPTI